MFWFPPNAIQTMVTTMLQRQNRLRSLLIPCIVIVFPVFLSNSLPALANDVDASLQNGLLKIAGDNQANDIVVEETAGDVVVRGRFGTTVNGQESVAFQRPDALEIRMKGGADFVRLSGLSVDNDVMVDLGRGDDRFRSTSRPCFIGGNLTVVGGSGVEIIRLINWEVGQEFQMEGRTSASDTLLQHSRFETIDILGGNAIDFVTIDDCVVSGSSAVETGGANDQVIVSNLAGGSLWVDTDGGVDSVNLSFVMTAGDIAVFTGNQIDLVDFNLVESSTSIFVSLDKGDDFFTGSLVSAPASVFDGGQGFDTFVDNGDLNGDVVNFEAILP
jgi:hypothetical protein